MIDKIVTIADNITDGFLNFVTNQKTALRIIKVLFGGLLLLFIGLIINTGMAIYLGQIKEIISGIFAVPMILFGICLMITVIHSMSQSIKQEQLDIERNDSGEDYIEVACVNYDPQAKNIYKVLGDNSNYFQSRKLDDFLEYIKQLNQQKIGKYIFDRTNNTFKKINMGVKQ